MTQPKAKIISFHYEEDKQQKTNDYTEKYRSNGKGNTREVVMVPQVETGRENKLFILIISLDGFAGSAGSVGYEILLALGEFDVDRACLPCRTTNRQRRLRPHGDKMI